MIKYSFNLRTKTIIVIAVATLILICVLLSSFFIPINLPTNFTSINQAPSLQHLFGTDWMGRDMFLRTIKGLSLSVFVGTFAAIISTIVAISLGLLSSINKYTDEFVAIIIDFINSIPHILLIILISIACGGGFYGVILGVGLTHWSSLARVLRAEVKQIKTMDFIKLSENLGKSKYFVAIKHILVLIVPQIIVGIILMFPHAIMHEASISFLGFGLPPHEPAIGIILSESMKYLASGDWWLALFPGLSLLLLVLLFDLIGDYLNKLLNPSSAQE
ncbi:ABC transporter permease [uncultured Methanobrevibacter sp.]|uniref:ABC transporter permease n=1 Tax=uncultured Methanobrevibacter sp. TaxID=253161 RepID=UPI0026E034E2|nr:ABC transporter permease [uncultured Methanobrevibacter sp.]